MIPSIPCFLVAEPVVTMVIDTDSKKYYLSILDICKRKFYSDTSRKFSRLFLLPEGDLSAKMATSRRTSQQQQQQNLSSPPRPDTSPLTPPESPTDTGGSAAGGEPESIGDREIATETPALLLSTSTSSSSSSSASSSTTGGGSSAGSTPDSGSASPGDSVCGTSGAFRELFEACRNGDVSRVKRLVDSANVNAKDMAGRKSTPLHFAAGKLNTNMFAINLDLESTQVDCLGR